MGVVTLLLAGLAAGATPSNPPEEPQRLRGQVIQEVVFEVYPGLDEAALRTLADLAPGTVYRPSLIRRSIERLFQLDRFDNVIVRVAPSGGGLSVRFELSPKPRLTEIEFVRSEPVDEGRLRAALGLDVGDPVRPTDLLELRRKLQSAMISAGYRAADVDPSLEASDPAGGVKLVVRVAPGPKTKIRRIRFVQSPVFPKRLIQRRLGLERGDVLDLDVLAARLSSLEAFYREEGYLDVEVGEPDVLEVARAATSGTDADLTIPLIAGPRVEIEVRGNLRVSRRVVESYTRLISQRGTSEVVLREVQDRILEAYRLRGFWRAKVRVDDRVRPDGTEKQVLVLIREGEVGRLGRVSFEGRSAFRRSELRAIVSQSVKRALASILGEPGADPKLLNEILGGAPAAGPAPRRQPDTTPPDPDAIYVARAFRNASDAISAAYRARGYQQVEVSRPRVSENDDGLLDVVYEIREGIQWTVAQVRVVGNVALSEDELLETVAQDGDVRPGQPLIYEDVEQARRAIDEAYRNRGYLYVQVGNESELDGVGRSFSAIRRACERRFETGESSCGLDVVFTLTEGPQVRVRRILVRGNEDTRESVVRGQLLIEPGDILRASELEQSRDSLLRIGVFDRVRVRPLNESQVEPVKDVLVELTERSRYGLEVGGGASTEEGFRVFVGFSDANLFGSAVRFRIDGRLNFLPTALLVLYNDPVRQAIEDFLTSFNGFERLEYQIASGVTYPRIFGLPRGYAVGLDLIVLRDLDPAFLEDTQSANLVGTYSGLRPKILGERRTITFQLRTGLERTSLQCNDGLSGTGSTLAAACSATFTPGAPTQFEGTNAYLTGGPRFSVDFRNDPLNPRSGAYLEVEGSLAKGLDANSPDLGQVEGRLTFFIPFSDRLVFSGALLGGRIFAIQSNESVPVNRRFFSGGRATIRGYQEQTLLPQDVEILTSEEDRRAAAEDIFGPDPSEEQLATIPAVGEPLGAISAGGLLFLAFKAELTFALIGPLSVAAFYDVGDLFESGNFSFSTTTELEDGTQVRRALAQGAGFGLRLSTPVGPIALDVARPVNVRDPGADDFLLHFAVGVF
ncbi:MAG: POTRA domain-containing protein [Myxococcota bacterium]